MMIVILAAVVCVAAAFGGCRFIRGQILDGPGMERDTLYNEDAVIAQVNAVYDYWNELRTNFDENKPYVTVDDRFGTKEWRQVRDEVAYEGAIGADSIQVKLQPDSTAEARFLVKDAVTIKGIPIRWLMKIEDGEWRVANIFFVKDNDLDILQNMRDYVESTRQQNHHK